MDEVQDGAEVTSNENLSTSPDDGTPKRRSLRTHKVHCLVRDCKYDSTSLINDKPIRMLDVPTSHLLKVSWTEAIPELAYGPPNGKICETHFEDPDSLVPIPTKNLPAVPMKLKKRPNSEKDTTPKKVKTEVKEEEPEPPKDVSPSTARYRIERPKSIVDRTSIGIGWRTERGDPISLESPKKTLTAPRLYSAHKVPMTMSGSTKYVRIVQKPKLVPQYNIAGGSSTPGPSGEVGEDPDKGQATATITASKPLDLNALLGDAGVPAESIIQGVNRNQGALIQGSGKEIKQEQPDALSGETSAGSVNIGDRRMKETSAPSTSKQHVPSPQHTCNHPSKNGHVSVEGNAMVTDSTCNACLSLLPTVRKSLGRLEMRLDTMVAMVRSLINKSGGTAPTSLGQAQPTQPSGSQPPNLPPQTASSITFNGKSLNSNHPNSGLVKRAPGMKGIQFKVKPAIAGTATSIQNVQFRSQPGSQTPLIGNGTFPSLAPSKLPNSCPTTSESVPYFQRRKNIVTPARRPGPGQPRKFMRMDFVRNPCDSVTVPPLRAPEMRKLTGKDIPLSGKGPSSQGNGSSSQGNGSPENKKAENYDSLVSSLFSAKTAPHEIASQDPSAVKRRVARALLLHQGSEFTFGEFLDAAYYNVKNCDPKLMAAALRQLIDDGLLYQEDDEQPLTDRATVFQKEQAKNNLRALKKYDIKMDTYIDRLTWTYEDEDFEETEEKEKSATPGGE